MNSVVSMGNMEELSNKLKSSNLFERHAAIKGSIRFMIEFVDLIFKDQELNDFMAKEVKSIKDSLLVLSNEIEHLLMGKAKELTREQFMSMMVDSMANYFNEKHNEGDEGEGKNQVKPE